MVSYPSEITQTLALGVGPVFPDFFKLSLEPSTVLLPQLVGTNTFKVKAEKLNKFDDAIALKVEGLPEGISAEVIDLRSLVPMDRQAVLDSVAKTGRCVIVQEAPRTCSVGSVVRGAGRRVRPMAVLPSTAAMILRSRLVMAMFLPRRGGPARRSTRRRRDMVIDSV